MTENNPLSRHLGYARVSTYGQTLDAQLEQLRAAGCAKIYREKVTGARPDRQELLKLLKALAPGDVVTVTRIDRLARSTFDLFAIVKQVVDAGAQFRSLAEPWADTATSTGRLMIAVLGGLADVERDLIRTRTAEGRRRAGSTWGDRRSSPRSNRRKHSGGGLKAQRSRNWRKATTWGGRRFHDLRDTQRDKTMSTEKEWVEGLRGDIEKMMDGQNISVRIGVKLPYRIHIASYSDKAPNEEPHQDYQTDLLLAEPINNNSGNWVPRVVVEFKLGHEKKGSGTGINTHDVLAYSAKAASHKSLHPYLRYGIIVGGYPREIPKRLIWHGHQFDFMVTLASQDKLTARERDTLCELLQDEVRASRDMSTLLLSKPKHNIRLVHRKLVSK